jgi:DNA-directed RNA polymerase sigma subunit (sigma70/sigma32)
MSNITTLDDMRRDAGVLLQNIGLLLGDYVLSPEERSELNNLKRKVTNITAELRILSGSKASGGNGAGGNESFTLEEIATKFGITRERARQIESSALKKLKHPKLGRKLRSYIDDTFNLTSNVNEGVITHLS